MADEDHRHNVLGTATPLLVPSRFASAIYSCNYV